MTRDLVILGCGGFGREVADVVDAINASDPESPTWNLIGFLDDSPSVEDTIRVEQLYLTVLGTVQAGLASLSGTHYVVGVGNGVPRKKMAGLADQAGLSAAVLIHPSARVGACVSIDSGTVICGGVSITTNIKIGRHVQINPNSTIGHDSTLGDFVTVAPLVAVSGNCTIGSVSFLGTHSTILPGVVVGETVLVGAAACVVRDVAPNTTVKGVPAK